MAAGVAGPTLAADVTQEVFIRLWRNPDRFDATRGSLRTFLLAVTKNVSIDHLRAEGTRRDREERDGRRPLSGPAIPGDVAATTDNAHHVHRALARLPFEMRQAIVTAYYGGLTYAEAADALGHPEGTVKSWIRQGLIRLRTELGHLLDDVLDPVPGDERSEVTGHPPARSAP